MLPYEIILEHAGEDGCRCSRVIIFEYDEDTGYRTVVDIIEAVNDFHVVHCTTPRLMEYRKSPGLKFRNPDGFTDNVPTCKTEEAFIKQLLFSLIPH